MPITLPSSPDGEQYEDFVVASLKVLGYFSESRLMLREGGKDVLELDVVATPAGGAAKDRQLFEAKKDAFHFNNIFKLFGQRQYLQISNACLVGLKAPDPLHMPVFAARGKEMGIRICNYTLSSDIQSLAAPINGLTADQRGSAVAAAWFQQIGRRLCEVAFREECKARPTSIVCETARTYAFNVRASFFQPTPLARAEALYSAYSAAPKLSGELVTVMATEGALSEQQVWNCVNDTDRWPWIQAFVQAETTARLAIIKNALDDFMERGALPPPSTVLKMGALTLKASLHSLPASFRDGLAFVQRHPHGPKLPYLFQAFAELLGGFLAYKDDGELSLVEALTGIPKAEVVDSIMVLDRFFAPDGGSMFYTQRDELLCMKMSPGIVRGGGAFFRQMVLGLESYEAKYPQMGWLVTKWHNALYAVLEPFLKMPAATAAVVGH